ncbi:MAG: hypothetical protein M3O23_00650 [Actinomycetota bacterium]|nr:hypothetical protein [Actinomycetota bacterium]
MGGDLESIRSRLEAISEELADLALDRLREAVGGDVRAPAEERLLSRARRAVDKAAAILGAQADDGA